MVEAVPDTRPDTVALPVWRYRLLVAVAVVGGGCTWVFLVPPQVHVVALWLLVTWQVAVAARRRWWPEHGPVATGVLFAAFAPLVLSLLAVAAVVLVMV